MILKYRNLTRRKEGKPVKNSMASFGVGLFLLYWYQST